MCVCMWQNSEWKCPLTSFWVKNKYVEALIQRWCLLWMIYVCVYMTISTAIAAPEIHQIQKLRFLGISRYKSRLKFGLIWICTEKFEFLDLVGFGGVIFSVDTVMEKGWCRYKERCVRLLCVVIILESYVCICMCMCMWNNGKGLM